MRKPTRRLTSHPALRYLIQRALAEVREGKASLAADQLADLLLILPQSEPVQAQALLVMELALRECGQAQTAIDCYAEALPIYRKDMSATALAFFLQDMGIAYERLGNITEASLQESIALLRTSGGSLHPKAAELTKAIQDDFAGIDAQIEEIQEKLNTIRAVIAKLVDAIEQGEVSGPQRTRLAQREAEKREWIAASHARREKDSGGKTARFLGPFT